MSFNEARLFNGAPQLPVETTMTQAAVLPTSETEAHTAAWPAVSLADSEAKLTAPGAMFEMETLTLDGRTVRVWKTGPKTVADVFYASQAFGERIFIVNGEERVSFDAFGRATFAFARHLVEAGVKPGQRVVFAMRNLPEWPVVFYGCALAGAVATPLNAWWSGDEMAYAIQDSQAVYAVFDAERFERVRDRLADCSDLKHVLVCRRPAAAAGDAVADFEDVIGATSNWGALPPVEPAPPVAIEPEDPATIFYTSGTTGGPKGVPASHRAVTTTIYCSIFSTARSYIRRGEEVPTPDPEAPQKCYVVAIPFFHVTGCFSLLNIATVTGTKLVLMRRFKPETLMELVQQERATSIGGVPTIPWQLLEHPDRDKYDLSSLESVTYGGAPAAPELVRRMDEAWPKAISGTGWGMTETCATFTHHIAEDYLNRPDSCGPVTPVGDMKVVDADGNALPPNSVGELWVYGPHVVRGYWNKPEATAKAFQDGWLKTGDLARIDEEGFCYIVDRIKDVIIRGGENIYSVEVEDVLYTHPAVMDAALVPIPHRTLGEEPGAVVTLKPGCDADEQELQAYVRARLAGFKTPVRVLFRHEPLPRNANGKILKPELKRLFLTASADA